MDTCEARCCLASVLVGDELGQLKRLELSGKPKLVNITTESLDDIHGVHPSKAIASISCLQSQANYCVDFLIGHKNNSLSLYNCVSNHLQPIRVGVNNESLLVSAQAIDANNIVLCYENGSVVVKNIERELIQSSEHKKKAMKLLGLDLYPNSSPNSGPEQSEKRKVSKSVQCSNGKDVLTPRSSKPSPKPSKLVNSESSITTSCTTIMSPNYNTSNTYVTSSKVSNDMLAIAGMNVDLKVLDLNTKQTIYAAKPLSTDWLGIKQQTWISGVEWVGGNSKSNEQPSWVTTCSRSDSVVRVYDIKAKQKKPVMSINLKEQTFNNESNPPSFTSLCSTSTPHTIAKPTQNLILGTTMGRMLALDLRFSSHSYRVMGVFKGFGGGAIRDIKYVPQSHNSFKILSTSLDRFVRIHNFKTSASSARSLEHKVYLKTRPTCLQPICTSFAMDSSLPLIDDMDDSDIE